MGRLGAVLKNPGFTSLLLVFSLSGLPRLAFVASSSYIYVNGFGLSEQVYSYFFALNALCLLLGPVLYLNLSRRFHYRPIIIACFSAMAVSGLLVCSLGNFNQWLFAFSLLPSTTAGSCLRPPGTNLMLEQQQEDTGSASSLIGCFGLFLGSVGMLLISFDWGNVVLALGFLNFLTGLTCGLLWLFVSRKPGVKQVSDGLPATQGQSGR